MKKADLARRLGVTPAAISQALARDHHALPQGAAEHRPLQVGESRTALKLESARRRARESAAAPSSGATRQALPERNRQGSHL